MRTGADLAAIRERKPLVHQITNYVVMNETANATLALGALPVMAHAPQCVFYLAGADPYEDDQLGGLRLTKDGLRRRDRLVLDAVRGAHWPARRLTRGSLHGEHRSRRVGSSPEFMEYRPWKTWTQFDKEIGKYVGADATFSYVEGNPTENVYVLRVDQAGGKLATTVIHTYPAVSQFWTYKPEEFLKSPAYTRDYPPPKP